MKIHALLSLSALLLLAGCSRTVDDVARWKGANQVPKLCKALEDPKAEVRLAATQALGELNAAEAVDELAAMYNDPKADVVSAAVVALASIQTDATITPLSAALRLRGEESRLLAATTLGEMRAAGAAPQLGTALDDESLRVRDAALAALINIADPSASPYIADQLNDPAPEFRLACINALAVTGGDAAAASLLPVMGDAQPTLATAAREAFLLLGDTAMPYAFTGLRAENDAVRSGALWTLDQLGAAATHAEDRVWLELAMAAEPNGAGLDAPTIERLASEGGEGIPALLAGCSHGAETMRELSILALEEIGEPALQPALLRADQKIGPEARAWAKGRSRWVGAPDWRLDLWAATSALNPTFAVDQGRGTIPQAIRGLAETDPRASTSVLIGLRRQATIPLLAALESDEERIAGSAAGLLASFGEQQAVEPLKQIVADKLAAEELSTTSTFYVALTQLNDPSADDLVRQVRPNPTRALNLFERAYGLRPISAETTDPMEPSDEPIRFELGYMGDAGLQRIEVIFARDEEGAWIPTPPLPEALP